MNKTKFVFVTGGVVSGLGKGITAASLGRLLKQKGLKIAAQKLDPYLNVDPGTMSPYEHGEVFVTEDGAETDLDIGHYERFIDENLTKSSNLTSGKVYLNVINKERQGKYDGKTVQVIPHVTNEIKEFIYNAAKDSDSDILITEIGGTVGDIECQSFLESARQIAQEVGKGNYIFIHVALVPYLESSAEHKSKPVQDSVKTLRSLGINPNIIVARSESKVDQSIIEKIAFFANVRKECVIENITLTHLYEAPLEFHKNGIDKVVCEELEIEAKDIDLKEWNLLVDKIKKCEGTVEIAIVGKYVKFQDAYLSIVESLKHAGYEFSTKIKIRWINSDSLDSTNVASKLSGVSGILVPGGFGHRGTEGKISAITYARVNNIPFFGICLGMQLAAIEFARSVCGIEDATSTEFDANSKANVICLMNSQKEIEKMGGTMRLGSYPLKFHEGQLKDIYGLDLTHERHRHRFEFNREFKQVFEKNGMKFSGTSEDETLIEAIEYSKNDFFIAVQYHPEFKSRPDRPHPLFVAFLKHALNNK